MKQQNETSRIEATNAQSYAQLRFDSNSLAFTGMKNGKWVLFLIIISTFFFLNSSIPDVPQIKIGTQIWTTKNLDVCRFRNGDTIHFVRTPKEWTKMAFARQPACCSYDNNPANAKKYGLLYNWYAVNDPRGLAPIGYHIPSDSEWTTLINYLGGNKIAGMKMKTKTDWLNYLEHNDNGNGDNSSGFSGLPGGDRYDNCFSLNDAGYWWTSTQRDENFAWLIVLEGKEKGVRFSDYGKSKGLSIRCIKD